MTPKSMISNRRVRPLIALLVTLASAVLAACGGSAEEGTGSGDDPGPEGVTVYSGRSPGLIGPAIDLYEADKGVDVQVRFGESAAFASTLIEEGENTPADVFYSQDAASLDAVAAEGLLAELPNDILEEVPRALPVHRRLLGRHLGARPGRRL